MSPASRARLCLFVLLAGCSSASLPSSPEDAVGPGEDTHDGAPGGLTRLHPSGLDLSRSAAEVGVEVAAGLAEVAELRVHVQDQDGEAVQNAVVDVGGTSEGTDENGDAVFSGLEAEATIVVGAHADGFLAGVRRVESLGDGTVVVVPLTSTDAANVQTYDLNTADGPVTLEDPESGFSVVLPGELQYETGEAFEGDYTVVFATFKAHDDGSDDPLAKSPGPLLTAAAAGTTPDALQSFGMGEVIITDDETDAPLSLRDGEPARVTRTLSDDDLAEIEAALAEDADAVPEWWHLDMTTGQWERYEGVDATLDDHTITGDLPHFSAYNLDIRWSSRCAKATLGGVSHLRKGVEVHVKGGGLDTWIPVDPTSDEATFTGLPKAALQAELYVYDARVAGPVDLDLGLWNQIEGTCQGSAAATLNLDPPESSDSSAVPVLLRLRAGGCPAVAEQVVFSQGGEVWPATVEGGMLASVALPEGTYDVMAFDTDGSPIGRDPALSIEADPDDPSAPALAELDLSKADPNVPIGGCRPLPCQGDACDSAVHLSALSTSGALVPRAWFMVNDEPIAATSGEVCVPVSGGANETVTVTLDGGGATLVALPLGATCDNGLAAEVSLVSGESCPLDQTALSLPTALVGAEDPRFYETDRIDAPGAANVGTLALDARVEDEDCLVELADLPDLGWEADDTDSGGCAWRATLTLQSVWGWASAEQAADGSLTPDALHLRTPWPCEEGICAVEGISLDIPLRSDGTVPWGAWSDVESTDIVEDLRLSFLMAPRLVAGGSAGKSSDGDSFGYDLPMGLVGPDGVSLDGTEDGASSMHMEDAHFRSASTNRKGLRVNTQASFDLTLSGGWTVPLVDRSQFPQDLANAATRPVYGVRARIVRPSGDAMPFGPSDGTDELLTCPVGEDPFYVVAEATPDAVPGISPLLVMEGGEVSRLGEDGGTGGTVFYIPTAGVQYDGPWIHPPADVSGFVITDKVTMARQSNANLRMDTRFKPAEGYANYSSQRTLQFATYTSNLPLLTVSGVAAQADELEADLHGSSTGALAVLVDNDTPTTSYTPTLYQIDRAWLHGLYVADGQPDADLDQIASVLASPPECADGGCLFALTLLDGSTCGGTPTSDDSVSTTRAFLGLDASCMFATWDNPWELSWENDSSGAYGNALFLLEPGTAMVLR